MYRTPSLYWVALRRHLENHFQLDRHAEWQARDAEDGTAGVSLLPKDILQHFRGRLRNLGLIAHVSGRGDRDTQPDDTRHLVERSEILSRHGEDIHRREMRRGPPRLDVDFGAKTSCNTSDAASATLG